MSKSTTQAATEPRIVSPEEAQGWLPELVAEYAGTRAHRCVYTVATEPDRTRAAVATALWLASEELAKTNGIPPEVSEIVSRRAREVENGADW